MVVYLIEASIGTSTLWWAGDGWTGNAWDAIWFVRKIDGENTIRCFSDVPDDVIVTEHIFSV